MSKNIEAVVICCFKRDIHLLRICIASVRFWYPEIPIQLLKDEGHGGFSTKEMEKYWNVSVLETEYKIGGWGLTKLEALFSPIHSKVLLLDTDTVFIGPVLDHLHDIQEDFIVTGVKSDDPDYYLISRDYIVVEKVVDSFDTNYEYPGFGFNSGHVVITRGLFERADFENLVDFTPNGFYTLAPVGLFPYADQGIFNYVLAKKAQCGQCTVRYADFWYWSGLDEVSDLSLECISSKKGYPRIIHWAGTKSHFISRMHRSDILSFFEDQYYNKISAGLFFKPYHHARRILSLAIGKLNRKFYSYFNTTQRFINKKAG